MSTVKKILTITNNDAIKEFSSTKEILDYYKESTKYIITIDSKHYKITKVNDMVNGLHYNVNIKDQENQDTIIKYNNFKIKIIDYFENKSYKENILYSGYNFEIIDNNGDCYNNIKISSFLKDKSFSSEFLENDWKLARLENIIKFMTFIQSFEDLREVEKTFLSYN
ncbi:MAG TPA: hypothetical protein PLX60_11540 [Chitinophagales bacterium]|nr:hypothetical protein [Chitinophagales bacterium]